MPLIVTFDVFSALTDSRSGGSTFLELVASEKGWSVAGFEIYDRWDSLNKELHGATRRWVPFGSLSEYAMKSALSELGQQHEDAAAISKALLESMVDWPLWPDVTATALLDLGASRLGLLSNIDDDLLKDTAAMRLGVFDPDSVVTSERAQAYKPAEALYRRATDILGPFIHVASSARDVSGAVRAGIRCVRLARRGHSLDTAGPIPQWTANSVLELPELVVAASLTGESDGHRPRGLGQLPNH